VCGVLGLPGSTDLAGVFQQLRQHHGAEVWRSDEPNSYRTAAVNLVTEAFHGIGIIERNSGSRRP
jgi:hypothetical protein